MAYRFFGDSLLTDVHSSSQAASIPYLLQSALGLPSITVYAVSGQSIADQALNTYLTSPAVGDQDFIWVGTNDEIQSADSTPMEASAFAGLKAVCAKRMILDSERVVGQSLTTTGSWSNMDSHYDPHGIQSTTIGSAAYADVTGRFVVVGGWSDLTSAGTASVHVGNNDNFGFIAGSLTFVASAGITTNSPSGIPTVKVPFIQVYDVGDSDASQHRVTVTMTSATGAGNVGYVSYIAGLAGNPLAFRPVVYVFNFHDVSAAAAVTYSITEGRAERFNAALRQIVTDLKAIGLWIFLVDAKTALWDTSLMTSTDGLHFADAGALLIADQAINVFNFVKLIRGEFTPNRLLGTHSELLLRQQFGVSVPY